MWNSGWKLVSNNGTGTVQVSIHGQRAVVNVGNTYPVYSRRFPLLNSPLVELVYVSYVSHQRKINIIDVGAATGDTILLLRAKCPDMLNQFYCIDGDTEFFGYLKHNVGDLPGAHLFQAMLSSSETFERDLVRTHGGTASAQGVNTVPTTTLDAVVAQMAPEGIDVLKLDVDGFDGKVLLGSQQTLEEFKPCVVFEWHPILCAQTANNYTDHFECLAARGYERFLWYDKFGNFSHPMKSFDREQIAFMARYCQEDPKYDMHFDIVALPGQCKIDPLLLARLKYARTH